MALESVARSEAGVRANNEDSVFVSPRLVALADGVGGAAAGEVASRWAVNQMVTLDKSRLTQALEAALQDAVIAANATLRFLIECRPEWDGMATTLSAVALSNDREYLIANVGDSRTYVYRDGRLRQLSHDQSYVQMLIDEGAITPEQALTHPQRSVVLDAIDGGDRRAHAPLRYAACLGDRLLLCSDGISDYLRDDQIESILSQQQRDSAADLLVSSALAAGSRDNVSAIVAEVVERSDPEEGWLEAL
jgi:serine/threonine protein phosphatase PrpC